MAGARRPLQAVPEDSFASMLRARRETEDLTQAELSLRFGVRQQTVGAWERGERPQARFIPELATYLDRSEDELRLLLERPVPAATAATAATPVPEADAIDLLTIGFAERMKRGSMSPEEIELFRDLFDYHRGVDRG